jgi:hypothetical protein
VEQRHRDVVDVVGRQAEPLGQVLARVGDLLVGDPHRLRPAAGAGREDQHEERRVGHVNRSLSLSKRPFDRLKVRGVDDIDAPQVESVEQVALGVVGDEHLHVGAVQVGDQGVAAAGAVDADRDVAAQPGGREVEQHLGGVVHQEADVLRAIGVEAFGEGGGARRRVRNELAPRPASAMGQQGWRVLLGPGEEKVPNGQVQLVTRGRRRAGGRGAGPAPSPRRTGTPSAWRR